MTSVEKISKNQIILLIVGCRIATAYTNLPILKIPSVNQDAWIVAILSSLYVFILCFPLLYLSNKFSDKTLIQYTEIIMGKVIGKFLGLLMASFLIFIALMELVVLVQLLSSAIMTETPIYALVIFMIVPCIYAAHKGIEPIARTAEVAVIYILFTIVLFTVLSINNMNFKVFLPILADSKFSDINLGALQIASKFSDMFILFMLAPNIHEEKSINKVFIYSTLIFTIFFIIIIVSTQAVLGIEIPKYTNNPYFLYTKQVDFFDFITHIEGINLLGWCIGLFIKFSTYLYLASQTFAQVFNTKTYKIFILPIIMLIVIISITTKVTNVSVSAKILSYEVYPYIGVTFILIIPLILLIVYFFRKKSFVVKYYQRKS